MEIDKLCSSSRGRSHAIMNFRQGSIVKTSPGPFEQSHHVTLSEAKGPSRSAARCFAEFILNAVKDSA